LSSIGLITFLAAVLWRNHNTVRVLERDDNSSFSPFVSSSFMAAPYRILFSCIVILCLGILSWKQSYIYMNEEILWTETLKKDPKNFAAHNNLGEIFLRRKDNERSAAHFQAAMDLEPEVPEPHYNMAIALSRLGRVDEAITHGQHAVNLNPHSASFHSVLASALWTKGNTAQAIEHFRTATQLFPTIATAHYNLGLLYLLAPRTLTGIQPKEAIPQFEKALALDPGALQTQYTLAWALATFPDDTVRDGRKAVQVAEHACQQTHYQNPHLLDALAAAYAETGEFSLAMHTAQAAVDLAQTRQQGALVHKITTRLELYRAGQPYRDSLEQLRSQNIASSRSG